MGRLLLYILVGAALYFLVRGSLRKHARRAPPAAGAREPEAMVACARCGVNMPRSVARPSGERWVCADNPHCR